MRLKTTLSEPIVSSFLSCEKDTETILRKLFVDSQPHSDMLKKLLVVQSRDVLDKNYNVSDYNLKRLLDEKYVVISPKAEIEEPDQIKSFITINFDNFITNQTNPEFRDCMIYIDIACHFDQWELGDYRLRPYKIMGIIDGILNKSHLSGIGSLTFVGGHQQELVIPHWSVHTLQYLAIHGSDDKISNE